MVGSKVTGTFLNWGGFCLALYSIGEALLLIGLPCLAFSAALIHNIGVEGFKYEYRDLGIQYKILRWEYIDLARIKQI